MNCAMIRFVFLLSSGDSEYVYMYVDCDFVSHNKKSYTQKRKLKKAIYIIYQLIYIIDSLPHILVNKFMDCM